MDELDLLHFAATVGFCSLLWVVQLVVYPQMARVRAEDFSAYHQRHTRSISWIVAPLFLVEGGSAVLAFWWGWQVNIWGQVTSLVLFIANTLLTFCWFVPAHGKLEKARSEELLRKLVAVNGWRTALSTFRVVVVYSLLVKELA